MWEKGLRLPLWTFTFGGGPSETVLGDIWFAGAKFKTTQRKYMSRIGVNPQRRRHVFVWILCNN
jgi:hypothetical protein